MIVVDLFAGAGGAHTGVRRALGPAEYHAVELDPHAAAVLRAAHPDVTVHERPAAEAVSDLPAHCDLLWASPPCQRHSRAGKGEGYDGWPDVQAYVLRARPQLVVLENVVGAPVLEWATWLQARGYLAAVWDLDAADYGVPQHRQRRFVVGRRADPSVRQGGPPQPTHGPGQARPWVTMRDALGLPLGVRVEGGGANPGRGRGARSGERRTRHLTGEPSTTIAARPGGNAHPEVRPPWWYRDGDPDAPSRTVSTRGNNAISYTRDASGEIVYPRSCGRAGSEPERLDQPSPTVTTTEGKGTRASDASGWTFNGGPDRASDAAFLATGRRRLTPSECATLQGFPEDYPWGERPKVHRYRLIGNAVPPRLAEVVVEAVISPASPLSPPSPHPPGEPKASVQPTLFYALPTLPTLSAGPLYRSACERKNDPLPDPDLILPPRV